MAWTTPRDWTAGEIVTEAMMDVHVRDNLTYLKDVLGGVQGQLITIKAPATVAMTLRNTGANDHISIRFMGNATAAEQWAIGNEISTSGTGRNFDIYDVVSATNRFRLTSGGQLLVGAGAIGTPAVSFIADADSGLFSSFANEIAMVAGGSYSARFGVGRVFFEDGALATPSLTFANDIDTGMYRVTGDAWALLAGGVTVLAIEEVGAAPLIGFYGSAGRGKQTVTGSRAGNAALTSLLTALDFIGLLTNSSSA